MLLYQKHDNASAKSEAFLAARDTCRGYCALKDWNTSATRPARYFSTLLSSTGPVGTSLVVRDGGWEVVKQFDRYNHDKYNRSVAITGILFLSDPQRD